MYTRQYPAVGSDHPISLRVKRSASVNFFRNTVKFAGFSHRKMSYQLVFFFLATAARGPSHFITIETHTNREKLTEQVKGITKLIPIKFVN